MISVPKASKSTAQRCIDGVGQVRGLGGGGRGVGVRSGPGEARTILLLHIISDRPSKQSLMVRIFHKVYMEICSYFVSARTKKRHHHHLEGDQVGHPCDETRLCKWARERVCVVYWYSIQ